MKYREVKASERLPDKNWSGPVKEPPDDMDIQFFHGTYYDLTYNTDRIWLEEIDEQAEAQAKDDLIQELQSYIEFLGEHLSRHEAFMSNRAGGGASEEDIDEGKKRRAKIAALKEEAGLKYSSG